jgi:uncharacterized membrane protein
MDEVYLASGSFTCLAALVMLTVYSLTTNWWRTHLGRMMATYAVAETGMAAIFVAGVSFHINPHWFRWAWIGLQVTVGIVLWYQTITIIRLNRSVRKAQEGDNNGSTTDRSRAGQGTEG